MKKGNEKLCMNLKKKGISLITLVVTIIIILILAGIVILTMTSNNPIDNAKIVSLLNDKDVIKDEIYLYLSKATTKTQGVFTGKQIITGIKASPNAVNKMRREGAEEYKIIEGENSTSNGFPETTNVTLTDGTVVELYKIDRELYKNVIKSELPASTVGGAEWYVSADNFDVYLVFENDASVPQWMNRNGEIASNLQGIVGNATVEENVSGLTAADIKKDAYNMYGKEVSNYECEKNSAVNKWKIFYADSSNIYLIADDYISYENAPAGRNKTAITKNSTEYKLSFNNVYSDYDGSSDILNNTNGLVNLISWVNKYPTNGKENDKRNIQVVAYMLDTDAWGGYKGDKALFAIGGPTLELLANSYNDKYGDKIGKKIECEEEGMTSDGYKIKWSIDSSYSTNISDLNTADNLYVISSTEKAKSMWLASPSAYTGTFSFKCLIALNNSGNLGSEDYRITNCGLRPIVCLNSNVKLVKQADGTYHIK